MKSIRDFKDATKPLWFIIKPRHALHCKRRDFENCVNARAINSIPGVTRCKVFKTITYVWWGDDKNPTRYQNSPDAAYFAALNDRGGRRAIIDEIRDEVRDRGALRIELQVPRLNISKDFIRSDRMKKIRRKSFNKRIMNDLEGKPRRKYTKPSKSGMRSGTGRAHTWESVE